MIDRRIRTFLTLYDTMSYHEAANRLNLTQPAVTQQIQALENEYGQKLFLYDHRILRTTRAAATLAAFARSTLRSDRILREELASPDRQPALRIGATKSIGDYVLGGAVTRYLADPAHKLEVSIDNTATLLRRLDNDEIDFALVEGNFDRKRFGSRMLRREPFVGICAQEHPFAGRTVTLDALLRETLLLRERGSGTRGITERMLGEQGYTADDFARCVTISSFGLLCRLAAAGVGVSFVYSAVANSWSALSVFRLEGTPIEHALHYVFLRGSDAEKRIAEFGPID